MTHLQASACPENQRARTLGCLISVAAALSLGFVLVYGMALLRLGDFLLILILPAFAVAFAAGFLINRYTQRRLSARWDTKLAAILDEPGVTISQAALHPGDSVDVTYDQRALQAIKVLGFTMELVRRTYEPRAYVGAGSFDIEARHWDRSSMRVQRPGGEYTFGRGLHEQVTLTIPAQNAPSLAERALGRSVVWLVRTRLRVLQAPDFLREYLLEMAPADS